MNDATARDVMSTPVLTVERDDPLGEVAGAMIELGIRSVVVIDDACRPLGILTASDFVNAAAAGDGPAEATVDAYLTPEVVTVDPDATLTEVAALMVAEQIDHVPVVDGETVVGIVTTTDLTAAVADEAGEAGDATAPRGD